MLSSLRLSGTGYATVAPLLSFSLEVEHRLLHPSCPLIRRYQEPLVQMAVARSKSFQERETTRKNQANFGHVDHLVTCHSSRSHRPLDGHWVS
jgi:hypothetical protein